ncbi:MAG: PHP domain-containing protein [Actinomycetota bacterium]
MSGFVHLHCHTTWSLLDGAIPADHLPHLAAERGYDAVAMTDHDSLLGAVRFARACEAAGIKPIYGAELTVSGGGHVTVIARNKTGYANLCRLITTGHLSNERGHPSVAFEDVAERAEGLFVLSGCERGEVARLAAAGRMPAAVAAARKWRDAIGDGYRIEVFDHRGYGDRTLRDRLLEVARDAVISAVATNDVHYVDPVDAITHELLHSIHDIVPLCRPRRCGPTPSTVSSRPPRCGACSPIIPRSQTKPCASPRRVTSSPISASITSLMYPCRRGRPQPGSSPGAASRALAGGTDRSPGRSRIASSTS